jgi:hypothetical protein
MRQGRADRRPPARQGRADHRPPALGAPTTRAAHHPPDSPRTSARRGARGEPYGPHAPVVTHPLHKSPSREAQGATLARWQERVAKSATIPCHLRAGSRLHVLPVGSTVSSRARSSLALASIASRLPGVWPPGFCTRYTAEGCMPSG